MFRRFTSRQLGLSQPTPPISATLNRATNTNDAGSPQTLGAYHFDSRSSTHLQSLRINASWPTRSKPYSSSLGVLCRYLREEGELACPCLVSALVIQPVLFSIHLHKPYTVGKLSISQAKICHFRRRGRKTKKIKAVESAKN